MQQVAHLGQRLDGDHTRPARDEEPRELPGPRRDVENRSSGTECEPLTKEIHRVGRVTGPRAVVQLGHAAESLGGRVHARIAGYDGVTR
jgi:hypothetical protein